MRSSKRSKILELMRKNNLYIILLIIFNLLVILINYQLLGKSGAFVVDNTINTLGFISLLVTISIAVFVPFLIKKAIDDNRGIKLLIIEGIKELIIIVEKNHKIVSDLYSQNTNIENTHRDDIRENFFDTELKIDSLKSQLEVSYPSKDKIQKGIFEDYLVYKQFLTDGKFMMSSYLSVDYDFYREEKNAFAKFQKNLIVYIHEIHKF